MGSLSCAFLPSAFHHVKAQQEALAECWHFHLVLILHDCEK